ncbi:alpha/beta fold hydrolase [Sulfitobacter aestuarii]|uniref:Alpha/beta fold hydrolase n=1 Tax=Sulfitobacter aestuarii TaxID=2161676 RepID=A0ABW5U3J6_9RHOB
MSMEIATRSYGHGARQALAIHCSLAHAGAWRGLGAALDADARLLAFDLPWHGRSANWDEQGDIHDASTAMARALLTEPMDLVGHSFGATVALRLAVERPELVRSLCLIEPVYFAAARLDAPERAAAYSAQSQALAGMIARGDRETATRDFNRRWGDGRRWHDFPQRSRDYMMERIGFISASAPFIEHDCAGLLRDGLLSRATMPVLLVEGDQSPDVVGAINDAIEKRLPDARRAKITGAGHMAPITHPEPVAEAIRELWKVTQERVDLRAAD